MVSSLFRCSSATVLQDSLSLHMLVVVHSGDAYVRRDEALSDAGGALGLLRSKTVHGLR